MDSRAPKGRGRRVSIGLVISAVVVAVVAVLFVLVFSQTSSPPSNQVSLTMWSMGQHLLNVWLEPDPPQVGSLIVTGQVVDTGGNPRLSSSMTFKASPEETGSPVEREGNPVEVRDRLDNGKFRASMDLLQPGAWILEVDIVMQGRRATVQIPFQVTRGE